MSCIIASSSRNESNRVRMLQAAIDRRHARLLQLKIDYETKNDRSICSPLYDKVKAKGRWRRYQMKLVLKKMVNMQSEGLRF